MSEEIAGRLARVREHIARAAERDGRKPEDVTLIAGSQKFDPATIQLAVNAGARDLGENRVQEALGKAGHVTGDFRWHLIGHLQSNKARHAVETFAVIHTIDSVELNQRPKVLIQVDLAHEPTKSGAEEGDLPSIIQALDQAQSLELQGLMIA